MYRATAAERSHTVATASSASTNVFRCFLHILAEEHARAEKTEAASRTIRTAAEEALWMEENEKFQCFEDDAVPYLATVEQQRFVSQSSFVSLTSL